MTVLARSHEPLLTPRALAERLLEDDSVRSVTIDPASADAAVCYRDAHVDRGPLADLAHRFRTESQAIARSAPCEIEVWTDPTTGRDSYSRVPQEATGWLRAMHLSLAALWFGLAVLGAILPGLPCTGFLLLCSYSLCRSSKRLHRRLLDSKWFGPTLRHWRLHRGVRPGVKTKALATMSAMVLASLAFAPLPPVAWWAVAAAGVVGAIAILRLRVVSA